MRSDRREDTVDIRAFLERLAGEARIPAEDAPALVSRARRRVAVTVVAATLGVALVAVGGAAALETLRTADHRQPLVSVPPATPTVSPTVAIEGRFDRGDLEDLVLRPKDRPDAFGLRHHPDYSEYESAAVVAENLGIDADELARIGFVESYINGFISPAWESPNAPAERRVDLISYAILFPDADAAQAGLELMGPGPTVRASGWTHEPIDGLGEEGAVSQGTFERRPTVAFVWRVDNVVLFVASQGYASALPEDVLRSIADAIDDRAG